MGSVSYLWSPFQRISTEQDMRLNLNELVNITPSTTHISCILQRQRTIQTASNTQFNRYLWVKCGSDWMCTALGTFTCMRYTFRRTLLGGKILLPFLAVHNRFHSSGYSHGIIHPARCCWAASLRYERRVLNMSDERKV